MNETHSYDPETFHPSITHSVYATLEGSRLRLAYPRANIPRWATLNETPHEAEFLHSRMYQLVNSKVSVFARKCVTIYFQKSKYVYQRGKAKVNYALLSFCTRSFSERPGAPIHTQSRVDMLPIWL